MPANPSQQKRNAKVVLLIPVAVLDVRAKVIGHAACFCEYRVRRLRHHAPSSPVQTLKNIFL
jgi:hypothetical protein